MDAATVKTNIAQLAEEFASERSERLSRTRLDKADFERLARAGYLLTGLPQQYGGLWQDLPGSTRLYCDLIRMLAGHDPSLTLVATMHPTVVGFWLGLDTVEEPYNQDWQAQRQQIFDAIRNGRWFGTIASEPGSGGDLWQTRTSAKKADKHYLISGDKHMGSGSGVTSFMITTAVPEGESEPDLFLLDTRELPWDGSAGIKLMREWDAYGMAATQSHAFRFNAMSAARCAWPGHIMAIAPTALILAGCLFSAVIIGIIDTAVDEAKRMLKPRQQRLKAFEQIEWTRGTESALVITAGVRRYAKRGRNRG